MACALLFSGGCSDEELLSIPKYRAVNYVSEHRIFSGVPYRTLSPMDKADISNNVGFFNNSTTPREVQLSIWDIMTMKNKRFYLSG